MVCFTPNQGFESEDLTKNRKRRLTLNRDKARRGKDGLLVRMTTKCNRCEGCRIGYSKEWAVKIMHEVQMTNEGSCLDKCSFITLTYNDKHLPLFGNLEYERHFKKVMKRMRKDLAKQNIFIRYYAVGEYGDYQLRPHFHAIIFGYDFPDRKFHKITASGETIYRSAFLEKYWTVPGKGGSFTGDSYGFSSVGNVTFATAAYVARYSMKKKIGCQFDGVEDYVTEEGEVLSRPVISTRYVRYNQETGERVEVNRERALISNRVGIGKTWFDKYSDDIYVKGNHRDSFGNRLPTPSYYDVLLARVNPQLLEDVKRSRQDFIKENISSYSPERLADARKIFLSRTKNLKRQIRNVYDNT